MRLPFGGRTSLRIWPIVALLILVATSAYGKVKTPDWKSLFRSARAISVVRVDSVKIINGVRIAKATVLEPITGLKKDQQIAYVAQPGWFWLCDGSDAHVGETALLLLVPIAQHQQEEDWRDTKRLEIAVKKEVGDQIPLFAISWSGRGRLRAEHRSRDWWITEPAFCDPPIHDPAFLDPPTEFKRQQHGHSIPLAAIRAFEARLGSQRGGNHAALSGGRR